MEEADEDLTPVYSCYDDQLCDRVLQLLQEIGVEAIAFDHTSAAFPVHVGTAGQKIVAVDAPRAEQARQHLREAIDDAVLTADGTLLEA